MGGNSRLPGPGPSRIGTVSGAGALLLALRRPSPARRVHSTCRFSHTPFSRWAPAVSDPPRGRCRRPAILHAACALGRKGPHSVWAVSPGPSLRRSLFPDRPGSPGRSRRAKVPGGVEGLSQVAWATCQRSRPGGRAVPKGEYARNDSRCRVGNRGPKNRRAQPLEKCGVRTRKCKSPSTGEQS